MLDIVIRKLLTNLSPEETYRKITTDYPGLVDSHIDSCLLLYWSCFSISFILAIICGIAFYRTLKDIKYDSINMLSFILLIGSTIFTLMMFFCGIGVSCNPTAELTSKIGYSQQRRIEAQYILDGGKVRK